MNTYSELGRVYEEIAPLRILSGDTSPPIRIRVNTSRSLNGASAQLILAQQSSPAQAVLALDCEVAEDGFYIILTSEDTQTLSGMYEIHVRIRFADGTVYRRVHGALFVQPVPKGSGSNA